MLPEEKVIRAESIDGGQAVVLHAARSLGAARVAPCTLLFDSAGALVGVDVDPDGQRCVLMLGGHEEVKGTQASEAKVDGSTVRVSAGRALRLR